MTFRKAFFLLFFILSAGAVYASDTDSVTIPKSGELGGRTVPAGIYRVEIDKSAEQPYLRLIKNQNIVAVDLAIVLPARGKGTTSAQITKVAGKEFIRIRVRSGDKWYLAYMSKVH